MRLHKFNKESSLRKLIFKQNKDKYIKVGTLIFSVVVIIIGILYLSFAKYESSNAFSVINSSVGTFTSSDVSVKFYLVGTTTEINPEKGTNTFVSGTCNNGANITWDEVSYGPVVSNITKPTSCSVYMAMSGTKYIANLVKGEPTNTLDVITKEAPDSTCTNTFGYDNTTDNNLRYVGANPCNYVYFNCSTTNPEQMSSSTCELWRIIGLMNNVDDGTGKKETRLKLIRRDSLGNYSWDTSTGSASATTEDPVVNDGYGINQWGASTNYTTNTAYPGADLMQELNGDYLNYNLTSNPMWYGYDGSKFGQNTEFDKTKALSASTQELIGDAVWYTGSYNDTNIGSSDVTTPVAYTNERSTNPSANASYHGKYCSSGSYCNDSIERTFTWTGKVGLQYPSDMGYATSGSTSMSEYTREKCINEVVFSPFGYYNTSDISCGVTSWLRNQYGWSLSPYANTYNAYYVGFVYSAGFVNNSNAHYTNASRPAVYLESSVKITGGNGSESSPYTLGQ